MKIKITRTSIWGDEQPCEEAIYLPSVRIDERVVSDPSLLSYNDNKTWYNIGKNHRVEDGHIKRDFEDNSWFIEINSLDELFALCKKYGSLIIEDCSSNPNILSIEIYDDYRE